MKILKLYFNAGSWSPSNSQWTYLTSCISKKDCEYVHNFKFKNDCKIRLLSQLLIRYSIKLFTELSWGDISIDRKIDGKPYYINKQKNKSFFDFNVSH
jgi:phosphopantetheinyl transferase